MLSLSINTITGVTANCPAAVLMCFSERENGTFANHPVVFVEGHGVCDPTSDLVARKIVVADYGEG